MPSIIAPTKHPNARENQSRFSMPLATSRFRESLVPRLASPDTSPVGDPAHANSISLHR
jgi:hypothetical protein